MDKERVLCWYCNQTFAEDEAVEMDIDGASEPVHEACREGIEDSMPEPG